ncbi:MAG TPA: LysM peptidoglycan-binding domain-containing protein [Candidatus Saccharimonadales bacterium]|nr:LysM peptidoglycan-binding domain-containing protein [Candidatus Saccharimonadales bacterium]
MRIARSVVALTIILAATLSYGHSASADSITYTNTATQSDASAKTEPAKIVSTPAVTVQIGDTLTAIADAHSTTVNDIMAANAINDPNLIEPGQVLQIPAQPQGVTGFSHSLKAAAAAFMVPPVQLAQPQVQAAATNVPAQPTHHVAGVAGNTYVVGTCTWYVKNRIPSLPNQLGNGGYGWLATAVAFGYVTGSSPAPGAIGVESGHVVYVESVNSDGTVNISEMNYAGQIGVVHYRTTSVGEFQYIYV